MLSDYRFAQTIYNLRVADANCFAKARSWRRTHTPTYHAKKRSIRLGLSVDTGKAARLSISAISTKPYPQIVQTYSPILESKGHVMTTTYVAGPTANDLLSVNATLTEYLARTAQLTPDNTCDRLLYPPTGYEDQPAAWRSEPDVPSSVVTYPAAVLSAQSTSSSASSSTLTTPVRLCTLALAITLLIR